MIVEPVPTSPRGPFRRLGGLLALALPLVLLVAAVGGGVLGRASEPAVAQASPIPTQVVDPAPDPSPSPRVVFEHDRFASAARFPAAMHGLPVRTVVETLQRHRAMPHEDLVAVAGYLSIRAMEPECTDRYLGPYGSLCHRGSVLADARFSPFAYGESSWRRIGPHLHPQFPVGVRMPHQAQRTTAAKDGPPLAVVVLGRFGDERARACQPAGQHCGEEFVVERVAWLDGEDWYRTTVLDPLIDLDVNDDGWRERRLTARALMEARAILSTAYVQPETLERIDPGAAAVLPDAWDEPVWYVLGLDVLPGESGEAVGRTRWILVTEDGKVLARGGEPATAAR
jgi:hypothetical protein